MCKQSTFKSHILCCHGNQSFKNDTVGVPKWCNLQWTSGIIKKSRVCSMLRRRNDEGTVSLLIFSPSRWRVLLFGVGFCTGNTLTRVKGRDLLFFFPEGFSKVFPCWIYFLFISITAELGCSSGMKVLPQCLVFAFFQCLPALAGITARNSCHNVQAVASYGNSAFIIVPF